uniref:MULE transposase domain-containing protein n=1 Tax=Ditylenchus dipsaci TaxID=166011 RepID=A0A915CNJ0_9BILA
MNAIGQAMGMDQRALMELVQIALNQLPVLPAVVQPAILDNITFVKSEKGKDKAVHKGFPFKQQRKNKDGSVQDWQCVKFEQSNGGRKARLQTKVASSVFLKFEPHNSEKSHNHALDPMTVPRSNVMANLKRRALDTREQDAPLALAPSISDSASRKLIRRHRIANQIPVVEANNVRNLTFPEASKKYTDAAGQEQLFVYAILAERSARNEEGGKWVFPVMYALLMNKSAASYTKMMELIKEVWLLFNSASINMDFEQAAIQSAILVFTECQISGCLFYLAKNFKKKIREVNLTTRYREPEFSVRVRMIMSLAFVPPATIWDNFEILRTYLLDNNQDLAPVLNWFRKNYFAQQ